MTEAQQLVERLKQHYSGPMSAEEVKLIRDMQAFLDFCVENGLSAQAAFANLAHDVNGLLRQEREFVPKVAGYAEIQRSLHSAKNDPDISRDLGQDDKWE